MNWQIIFSTYINKSGTTAKRQELEQALVMLAKRHNIQGFSLSDQLGYWAGELEQSHVLELLDTDKSIAFGMAEDLKRLYSQDAVIVRPVKQAVYFI